MIWHGFSHRFALPFIAAAALISLSAHSRAQSYPPVWSTSASYAAGDTVQYGGNWYRSMKAQTPNSLSPATTYANWELNYVRSSTTLNVGVKQAFPLLINAWTFAHNARIADGAYVHLAILTTYGKYSQSGGQSFSMDQGSGANISIIGDNVANILFTFGLDGFTIDTSHSIALISGVGIVAPHGRAFWASSGASIGRISNTTISNVGEGVEADTNASVSCDSSVSISGFVTAIAANNLGSVAVGSNASFDGGGKQNGDTCFGASWGGVVQAENCSVTNCGYGAYVEEGGIANLDSSYFGGCGVAVLATIRGHVEAGHCTFGNPAADTTDIVSNTGSTVDAPGATFATASVGNSDGSYIFGP